MNSFKHSLFRNIVASLAAVTVALASLVAPSVAIAATQNYPLATPVMIVPFHISG